MLGFIYFFVVLCSAICYYIDRANSRQRSRWNAISEGHFDYRDMYGRYWFDNIPCNLDYKDGHQILTDKRDRSKVYVDYTQQANDKACEWVNSMFASDEKWRKVAIEKLNPLGISGWTQFYKDVIDGKHYRVYYNNRSDEVILYENKITTHEDGTWEVKEISRRELHGDEALWYRGRQSMEWKRNYIIEHGLRDVYGI